MDASVNMDTARNLDWLDIDAALARLGVARQTLYAYVSRGLIRSRAADDDPRRSLYDRHAIDALLARRRRGRAHQSVAASTIDWGEPVLVSRITRIAGGRVAYRGHDAIRLAETATLEQAAALLWEAAVLPRPRVAQEPPAEGRTPLARCMVTAARLAIPGRFARAGRELLQDAATLLDRITAAAANAPGGGPAHATLAVAWGVDARTADLLRRALVLCADHELNASTFAVRVAASTGASLPACLLAGLATLSGPLHGGMTDRLRAMLDEPGMRADPARAVAARLARGDALPGFGHRLYPQGDPRAMALCVALPPNRMWRRLMAAIEAQTGELANIDAALVMLEDMLHLPAGASAALFAVGRTVGWIAHALEQRQDGRLIRPRAVYAGPPLAEGGDPVAQPA